MEEYGKLRGGGSPPTPVPVEATGGPGTRDSHWRDSLFRTELMTGFVNNPPNPVSRVTAASLEDLGYSINMNVAEPYGLPNLRDLAEGGLLSPHLALDRGVILPSIPIELPESCQQ